MKPVPSRSPRRSESGIYIEWFTISHRTLYLAGGLLALLAAGGAAVYYLYLRPPGKAGGVDLPPAEKASPARVAAHFSELTGQVKWRKAGTYEWVKADFGSRLAKDDHIRTVGNSTARVRFFDGTEYLVKPDSLMVIEESHEDPSTRVRRVAVKLTAGQVNLSTPPRNVEGSSSELATPTTQASFGELTVADVRYDEASRVSGFTIFRGESALRAGEAELKLRANQAVEVRENQRFSEIVRLPPSPTIIAPGNLSVLVHPNPARATTELTWEAVRSADRYHLLLDRSPNFNQPLVELRLPGTTALVPGLPSGSYYWKVSAIDIVQREGGFSDFAKFTITSQAVTVSPPKLLLAEPSVSIEGVVSLSGVTDPEAQVVVNNERVSVKPDGSFQTYFTLSAPGRHAILVKALNRSGGTAEKTVYAKVGEDRP